MIARVPDDLRAAKREWRARIRQGRAASVGANAHRADDLLAAAVAAGLLDAPEAVPVGARGSSAPAGGAIAAYVAAFGEPDPGAIRAAVRASGAEVLLPVPLAGRVLAWARDEGRYEPAERLGVPQPVGVHLGVGAAVLVTYRVGLVLAPALAVDRSGTRLGQGGGYYDTLLAELAALAAPPRVVIVVHDDEVLAAGALPRDEHDVPVREVLTPSGLLRLA